MVMFTLWRELSNFADEVNFSYHNSKKGCLLKTIVVTILSDFLASKVSLTRKL